MYCSLGCGSIMVKLMFPLAASLAMLILAIVLADGIVAYLIRLQTLFQEEHIDRSILIYSSPSEERADAREVILYSPLNSTKPFAHSIEEVTVEVYFYMIAVETNSDWTTVEFSGGPIVVGYNYTLTRGSEASDLKYSVDPMRIWISKNLMIRPLFRSIFQ